MKSKLLAIVAGVLLGTSALWGAYTWTISRDLNTSGWNTNFTVFGSLSQYTYGSYTGVGNSGQMIYNGSTTLQAANMVLRIPGSGTAKFSEYVGAKIPVTGDTGPVGPFIETDLQLWGTSPATLQVNYGSVGSLTLLANINLTPHDNMTVMTLLGAWPGNAGYSVDVYVDNNLVLTTHLLSSGYPLGGPSAGFGVIYGGAAGFLITHIDIGQAAGSPVAIPSSSITISPSTNYIDLNWPAGSDGSTGMGVMRYEIWRGGALLGTTTGLSYSDTTVNPSTPYSYTLKVVDYFFNEGDTTFSANSVGLTTTPPPSGVPEGRRVGVRPTGAYWGASPENIDVRSGNLSFSLPLLSVQGRAGLTAGFGLSYNSQNWRYQSSTNQLFDGDVGYGFGWRLQAGSITPVWNTGGLTASYFLFIGSTGAEYRLDQNSGNVWSSTESVYVYFDANTNILHFNNGANWYFGCVSATTEQDAGVMYPTLMQDTHPGNQITISYYQSSGAGWLNSSARIYKITDTRAPTGFPTYMFLYNADSPTPHLHQITNYIGTSESFTPTYLTGQALASPFDSTSFGTTAFLSTFATVNGTYTFTHNGSGELTKVVLPKGGYLAYDYGTAAYTSGKSFRQVTNRYLSKDGSTQTTYPFSHETSLGPDVHAYTIVDDPGGVGEKYWAFSTSGTYEGLVTQYQGRQLPGPLTLTQNDFTWAQDSVYNSYISNALTTADPGQAYQAQKQTAQTVDIHGNVTQVQNFDWNSLTTPKKTYNYTYLAGTGSHTYITDYVMNRMLTATVTDATYTNLPLVTNRYDGSTVYTTYNYGPGDLTTSITLSGTSTASYDSYGNLASTTNPQGLTTTATTLDSTNSVPTQITVGSLTNTLTYTSFLASTGGAGPNGDTTSIAYGDISHPSSTTSAYGVVTNYTYTTSTTSAVVHGINPRWTRTTLDGLGRTIEVETGTGTTVGSNIVNETDTTYDSCGCSPLGKLMQVSLPHAHGAAAVWTTYTYDGIGRTLSVTSPDGQSATTYLYQGNTVTVTDPAGAWKQYTSDAFGRLTQVQEPDPTSAVKVNAIAGESGMLSSEVQTFPSSGAGSWGYQKTITIDHTKVSGSSSLVNFPVLISVTDANLKTVANGGYVGKNDGTDIYFTDSSGLKLSHEIESYAPTTGALVVWVRIASLSPTSDTTIYAYYGNPIATDQQDKTHTWDGNYQGVWHLPNGTTLSPTDSTANTNNGWGVSATANTGKIGGGANFSSSNIPLTSPFAFPNSFTVSAWVKGTGNNQFYWETNNGVPLVYLTVGTLGTANKAVFSFRTDGNVLQSLSSATTVNDGNWHLVQAVRSGTTAIIYFDGNSDASSTVNAGSITATGNAQIGVGNFVGSLDELRVSNVARSSDWILTEYRNQNSPSTFYTLGTQASVSQVTMPVITYSGGSVTMTDGTSGATIYYTTDGSTPTTSSTVYSGPLSFSTYSTTYTYDLLDHLTGVSMPRSSGTQTRSFNYIDPATSQPGTYLQSVTNPENGTVSYTYDSSHRLSTVIDAKNQKKLFTYDTLNRVTKIQRYVYQSGVYVEDLMQQTNSTYDSGTYGLGRLTGMTYNGGSCTSYNPYSSPAGCDAIQETYTYNQQGAILTKALKVTRGSSNRTLTATWTMDTDGRPATVTYPSWKGCSSCSTIPGSSYTYAYDSMGRTNTLTDTVNTHTLISGMTYGVANEVQQITSGYTTGVNSETHTYNSMFQLTHLQVASALNITYIYSSSQNNGKITSQSDVISGEQIAYTYDALNRLASAQTTQTGGTQWGQSYTYDGFGNLTDQTVIKGSAPDVHVAYNYLTNRQTGDTADANGNIGSGNIYDLENRLVQPSGSTARYGYDPGNKRMWRGDSALGVDEIAFWAGQKLATYQVSTSGGLYFTLTSTDVYFGAKLISKGTYNSGGSGDYITLAAVTADRLGSIGKFYPYGTERPSATANDKEKFTGYFRDASTGLDYADQRYHQPGMGRFMTSDSAPSANVNDPGTWNRYAYVSGDPVNRTDPHGTCSEADDFEACGPDSFTVNCQENYANGFTCAGPWGPSVSPDPGPGLTETGGDHQGDPEVQRAYKKVVQALNDISQADFSSSPCQTDLTALGVTADQIVATAAKVQPIDGIGWATPLSAVSTQPSDYAGETVGAFFQTHSPQALAGNLANTIYIDPAAWNSKTQAQADGSALHEILHIINGASGLTDGQIWAVLFPTTPYGGNSNPISTKLTNDCVSAKPSSGPQRAGGNIGF